MRATSVFSSDELSVMDFHCDSGPCTPTFVERHEAFSLSFVRRGNFGYLVNGQQFDLVPGSVLVGRPGDEYVCTHEHSAGDECLSFRFGATLADAMGLSIGHRLRPSLPPRPGLMILGELAQSAANGRTDIGIDEAGVLFAAACRETMTERDELRPRGVTAAHRRKAIAAVERIDADPASSVTLDLLAGQATLSRYHFLRVFSAVVGVTPHQYLVHARLRRAARLLAWGEQPVTDVAYESGFADLSNFVRTFHRAAGVSPGRYRRAARGDRKIFQDRLTPPVLFLHRGQTPI